MGAQTGKPDEAFKGWEGLSSYTALHMALGHVIGVGNLAKSLSIRLFAALFAISLMFSTALTYYATRTMSFAFPICTRGDDDVGYADSGDPGSWLRASSVPDVTGCPFGLAGCSPCAGFALALRWLFGVMTSVAFLRGSGLIQPLGQHEAAIIATSTFQLALEALAILLLYGEDATDWFEARR
ncbi:hypothetical protein O6V14_18700 [Sphingomonas faeni]|uniref:hypothetical protein n=1 Tax=Sphingomonas faeni TaxID=185950 RepID=UPI003353C9AF